MPAGSRLKLLSRKRENRRVGARATLPPRAARERTPSAGGPSRGLFASARRVVGSVLLGACGVGAIGSAWFWLTRTDTFAIRNVAIEGTTLERGEEIRALLNLNPGSTSLLFLDLADARAHVEAHPWVARAFVKRELPDTLRIVVEEREPRLILALDRLYYVDATGTPFKALQPGDRYDLPVLTGLSREDLLAKNGAARDAIRGALDLAAALSSKDAAGALAIEDVSEISWDAQRGYSALSMKNNERVLFGTGDWESKVVRLREVREQRKGAGDAKTIDLTFASRVVVSR